MQYGGLQKLLQELFPQAVREDGSNLQVRHVHQLVEVVEPRKEGDKLLLAREVLMVFNGRSIQPGKGRHTSCDRPHTELKRPQQL